MASSAVETGIWGERHSAPDGSAVRSDAVLRCVREITDAIRAKRYQPDQRLGEATLAEELGYGKAQVRAALDQLAHVGVVERRPRSGTYVRRLSIRSYIELAEVRAALEAFAARVAATTIGENALKQLGEVADRLDVASHSDSEPWEVLMEMESEFHGLLAQAGGNHTLEEIVVRHNFLSRHLTEGKLIKMPTHVFFGFDQSRGEHRQIVDALAKRDPDLAEHEVRTHVLLSLYIQIKLFLRLPGVDLAEEDLSFAREWLTKAQGFLKTEYPQKGSLIPPAQNP